MGLDMYLTKRTYVKRWEHQKKEQKFSVSVKKGGKKVETIKPERVSYIIEEVGYWRKANHIHSWFVKNVQEGVDDCKEYYVEKSQLEQLLDTVNLVLKASNLIDGEVITGYKYEGGVKTPIIEKGKVIEDPRCAMIELPTESGFFFGCTEYDEYYIKNLEHTKKILLEVLAENEEGVFPDFYYQSSW
ncbi:MAG: hypothetical protein RLY43_702 [Bacteroidota bacterium]